RAVSSVEYAIGARRAFGVLRLVAALRQEATCRRGGDSRRARTPRLGQVLAPKSGDKSPHSKSRASDAQFHRNDAGNGISQASSLIGLAGILPARGDVRAMRRQDARATDQAGSLTYDPCSMFLQQPVTIGVSCSARIQKSGC